MLRINPDSVRFIIERARDFETQDEDAERETITDPTERNSTAYELHEFIDGLDSDAQNELVALAWIGRGDFAPEDWKQAVQLAVERHTGPTADYLMGMPLIPDYLEEALDKLGEIMEIEER